MEIISKKVRKSLLRSNTKYKEAVPKLSFYEFPPTEDISLQEFEEYAIERVKVLKIVETIGIRHTKLGEDYSRELRNKLKPTKLWKEIKTSGKFDHISHFILRLAYCRSDDLRRWFLMQELDLFRYRFSNLNSDEKRVFAAENNLGYSKIEDRVKEEFASKLIKCFKGSIESDYYKVYFTEVLDLVRMRKVYLEKGYAYVKFDDLISIISNHFRGRLSKALATTCRSLPHLEEDNRLLPLLNNLSRAYMGEDYGNQNRANAGKVTPEMLESLSKKSFSPCMQQLHQNLKQAHHLRHGGRMQYGLFLKGIGLSLDDALRFWRTAFSQGVVGVDKFDKSYAYNIRYNYGKEGKRANFTPHSCVKIIMTNPPGQGDFHGCVFRHTDPDLLKQRYRSQGMSSDNIEKILSFAIQGHYQLACMQHFEISHGLKDYNFSLQHPNQYFDESQKILTGEVKTNVSSTQVRVVKMSQVNSSQASNSTHRFPSASTTTNNNSSQQNSMMDDLDLSAFMDDDDDDLMER